MFTRAKIFRLIRSLPEGEIFTTRQLLHLGSRSAVDNALYNMVCENIIERLAWGVFRLSEEYHCKRLKEPSLLEIARAKVTAFARTLYTSSLHIFCQEDKAQPIYDEHNTFSLKIIGHSSSFRRVFKDNKAPITINLKGIAPRKAALAATYDGGILQSFWQLGKAALEPTIKSIALSKLKAPVKKAVIERTQHLPAWITNNILFKPIILDIDSFLKRKNQNGKNEPIIDYEILDILRAAHNQEQRGPDLFEDDSLEEGHDLEDTIPPPPHEEEEKKAVNDRNDEFEKDDDDDANDADRKDAKDDDAL
jgi:hypothetical protein